MASEHDKLERWIDSIDASCQIWKATGRTPFSKLIVPSSPDWHGLEARDLRYFHFLASLGDTLDRNNTRQFCLWWMVYDVGLQMAAKIDYVAYAQIVVAASRLGRITKLASIMEDAVRYRSLALRGLRHALASFSRENADGVLAASISLMYQQQTPADWQKITEGTAAVIKTMRPWVRSPAHWPVLKHLYNTSRGGGALALVGKDEVERSPQHLSGEHAPVLDTTDLPPLITVQSVSAAIEFLLDQGITALNRLAACTKERKQLSTTARELADMLRLAQVRHSTGQTHDPFWLAHPFSEMTNRESISFTEINPSEPFVLILLAYMYSSLVVLSILYPQLDSAGFIAIRLHSLDELARHFQPVRDVECHQCGGAHSTQGLLAFPWNAVRAYRQWRADLEAGAF